jgi:ribosome-associated protein
MEITPALNIDDRELQFDFVRAAGPGGQNVNKVATAAELRFDVAASASLPDEVKGRLIKLAGKRMTQGGILVIQARRFRTQAQNRADALLRFQELLRRAAQRPRARVKTAPSKSSKEKRLKAKKLHSEIKRTRRNRTDE